MENLDSECPTDSKPGRIHSPKEGENVGRRQLIKTKNFILWSVRLVALTCICCSSAFGAAASAPSPSPVIVAYVFHRDNPILPGEIAAQKLTRINYAFANINNGRIVNGYGDDDQN